MAGGESSSPLKGFFSSLATGTQAVVAERDGYKAAADGPDVNPVERGQLGRRRKRGGGRYCTA